MDSPKLLVANEGDRGWPRGQNLRLKSLFPFKVRNLSNVIHSVGGTLYGALFWL